jgi:hypothetical protein
MKNLEGWQSSCRVRGILLVLAIAATAVPAMAYDVTITRQGSARGFWSGGNPDVWTPNNWGGLVNVGEIETRLGAGTNVTISTTYMEPGQDGDLRVEAPIRWTTGATLTLFAHAEVKIDADIVATGATAGLAITSLGGATAGYTLRNGHTITLSGAAPSLIVGGQPYVWVSDIGALQAMSLGGTYALQKDIDASATAGWNGGEGFAPLGNVSTPFTGVFDGLGHTVTGLAIHRPGTDYVGLFGYCSTGTIGHVRLDGGTVTGHYSVGGLVGEVGSETIQGCSFTGTVTGAGGVGGLAGYANSIRDSYTTGQVSASQNTAGGLVGNCRLIDSCCSTASVAGLSRVGGLVGFTGYGILTCSYSSGPVAADNYVGGLVGYSDNADIRDSYSTSPVTGTPGESYGIGGLVGYCVSSTVSRCFSSGPVSGSGLWAQVGGLVGVNEGASITNCYWDTVTSGQTSSAGGTGLTTDQAMVSASYSGWDFTATWRQWGGATRPFLVSEGTTAIANAHQLQLMDLFMEEQFDFTLVRDIEMGELTRASGMWNTASAFQPTFLWVYCSLDGAGRTISGLIVHDHDTEGWDAGLFTGSLGTIRNLGLVGVSVTGSNQVGALMGVNDGAITNCYATGSVSGQTAVGGLVGVNAMGGITNCSSACTVTGNENIGGLVGFNVGSVTNSYSAGPVTGVSGAGGLVGLSFGGATGSFWDVDTSGQAASAGGTGKSTAEMMQLATFAGAAWDVDDAGGTGKIWRIYGNRTYPLLRDFLKPLSATAAADTRPYTGVGYTGGNGAAFSPSDYDASKVFGTGIYGGSSQGAIAPGTYAITPGAWSNQQGYDITAVSGTLTINQGPGVGRVPDGASGTPLRVSKNGAQLGLTWGASCGTAATDYAIYEGTLGSWYDHTPLVCTTSGALSETVTPANGNRYYLIAPLSATQEGSYGTGLAGAEIPQSSGPCFASRDLSVCL